MKLFVKFFFIALCIVFATTVAQAKTLKVISAFPISHMFTKTCMEVFEKELTDASGGELKITIMGPDVVPSNEQFQPVQSGVFDMLFTHAAYHMGTTAMGLAMEATDADPVKRRETGLMKFVDAEYQKHGMRFLSVMPVAEYNIVLNKPAGTESPSLKGLKIRTPNAVAPMVKNLGGAPVSLPPGEIYTAIQKGVIDGFTLVSVGLKDYKIHEVSKYLVRPTFGYISYAMLMNAKKFDKMTPEQKEWIQTASIKSEIKVKEAFHKQHLQEVKELKALGMEVIQLPAKDADRLDKMLKDTVWAVAEKKSGKPVADFHKLALEKGMAR